MRDLQLLLLLLLLWLLPRLQKRKWCSHSINHSRAALWQGEDIRLFILLWIRYCYKIKILFSIFLLLFFRTVDVNVTMHHLLLIRQESKPPFLHTSKWKYLFTVCGSFSHNPNKFNPHILPMWVQTANCTLQKKKKK